MLNDWVGFFSFIPTWQFKQLINCPEKIIGIFTGNQAMKTASVAMYNVMSILGLLPIEHKNIRPSDSIRILRFASEKLPNEGGEGGQREVKNTQYPEFKKWLPPSLIKKDISMRNPVMTLRDPQGGDDVLVEFVSFNQDIQAQAGVQRRRVWIDEHCKKAFYEEQLPRLLAANGDMIFTLTPAQDYLDWEYDEFYERAKRIIRTPTIVKSFREDEGIEYPLIEETGKHHDICIIMAATDDNPILKKEEIDAMYDMLGDPDIIAVRRFGKFKQISGKVFKLFDKRIHIISRDKYFPNGMPHDGLHARGIDYHENNPWAYGQIWLSNDDEAFIYDELLPSTEKVSLDIATMISAKSKDYKYYLSLIDPLAAKKQANTGMSVVDDLNRFFYEFQREGFGTGGYWQTWDTKSTRGRDEIRTRLANSRLCGVPFNNKRIVNGREVRVPTIWVLDNCRLSSEYMYQWRREEWASRDATLTKDNKDEVQQKWSHFNMIWEGIFKSPAFAINRWGNAALHSRKQPYSQYMRAV
jgi:hypothetical protein